jgi:hypothetical protein
MKIEGSFNNYDSGIVSVSAVAAGAASSKSLFLSV